MSNRPQKRPRSENMINLTGPNTNQPGPSRQPVSSESSRSSLINNRNSTPQVPPTRQNLQNTALSGTPPPRANTLFAGGLMPHQIKALKYVDSVINGETMNVPQNGSEKNTRKGIRRGALVWAGTGTGKTTIAAGIAMRYLSSENMVLIVSTVANTRQNNIDVYAREIRRYYPEYLKWYFKRSNVSVDEIKKVLNKKARFLTYERLYNCLFGTRQTGRCDQIRREMREGTFRSTFVIDEAHDMVSSTNPGKTEPERVAIDRLREFFVEEAPAAGTRYHVYALTATPGESMDEWYRMVKIVSPQGVTDRDSHIILGTSALRKEIVLRANLRGVTFRGKKILAEERCVTIDTRYTPLHFIIMLILLGRVDKANTPDQLKKLGMKKEKPRMNFSSDVFLDKFRTMQNYMLESWVKAAFSGVISSNHYNKVYERLSGEGMQFMELYGKNVYVSEKMIHATRRIKSDESPGRILAYTIDPFAAKIMGALLVRSIKGTRTYTDVTARLEYLLDKSRGFTRPDILRGLRQRGDGKRFAVATKPGFSSAVTKIMDGRNYIQNELDIINIDRRRASQAWKMEEVFQYENKMKKIKSKSLDGDDLKLLIIGGSSQYQGLDIIALRKVYMLDFMGSLKHQRQLWGRGARGFGHVDLAEKNQTVDLIQYVMERPLGFDTVNHIDAYLQGFLEGMFRGTKKEQEIPTKLKTLMGYVTNGIEFLHRHRKHAESSQYQSIIGVHQPKRRENPNNGLPYPGIIRHNAEFQNQIAPKHLPTINTAMRLQQMKPGTRHIYQWETLNVPGNTKVPVTLGPRQIAQPTPSRGRKKNRRMVTNRTGARGLNKAREALKIRGEKARENRLKMKRGERFS